MGHRNAEQKEEAMSDETEKPTFRALTEGALVLGELK